MDTIRVYGSKDEFDIEIQKLKEGEKLIFHNYYVEYFFQKISNYQVEKKEVPGIEKFTRYCKVCDNVMLNENIEDNFQKFYCYCQNCSLYQIETLDIR